MLHFSGDCSTDIWVALMAIGDTSATVDFIKLYNIDDVSSGIIALYVSFNVSYIIFVTLSISIEVDSFSRWGHLSSTS